jgi:hypothetical protein
MMVVEK